jgi:hypothetical protein
MLKQNRDRRDLIIITLIPILILTCLLQKAIQVLTFLLLVSNECLYAPWHEQFQQAPEAGIECGSKA